MITNEEYFRRKWGAYPVLGELLGHLTPGPALSSIESQISSLSRTIEIAVTLKEHADILRSATDPKVIRKLPENLKHLEDHIRAARSFFTDQADYIHSLLCEAHEKAHRLRESQKA